MRCACPDRKPRTAIAFAARGHALFLNLCSCSAVTLAICCRCNSAGSLVPPPGTYDDYVAKFIQQVKPNLLSTDHYPDFSSAANTKLDQPCSDSMNSPAHCKNKAGYIANMLSLRNAAMAADPPIGFWNFVCRTLFCLAEQVPT